MARWNTEALAQALRSLRADLEVEVVAELDSTSTELMRRARAGRAGPVLLVARRQTAGRGRLGRSWHSEADLADPGDRWPALTFSLGLPLALADWSGLSLAVGVAVAESLPDVVGLKWPNDLWLRGGEDRKLGGILIETASFGAAPAGTAGPRYAVIGIGLNILPRSGDGLRAPPAALVELWPDADAPQVLARVAPAVLAAVRQFEREGFAPFVTRFARRDVLAGRPVALSDGSAGVARGVGPDGALLVHTAHGMTHVTSAEVSVRPLSPTDAA